MFGNLLSGRSQKNGSREDGQKSSWKSGVGFGRKKGQKQSQSAKDKKLQKVQAQLDEQMQNRIIAYFANGQKMELVPAGAVEVTPMQREKVTQELQERKISARELEKFLLQILSPMQDLETNLPGIFQRIIANVREKQILAVAAGYNASNWEKFGLEDLKNWLIKTTPTNYQTPIGFASFRTQFLEGIKDQATLEQLDEYIQAMDDLERQLYDQRFAYYQQMQLLARPVVEETPTEATETLEDGPALQAIIAEEQSQQVVAPVESQPVVAAPATKTSTMTPIAPERSNNILSQSVIEADSWVQGGVEYRLSTANLVSGGLAPTYLTNLDGREIAFSVPFTISDGRGVIIGYVLDNNVAKVRSFYLNPRTGLWHYAPEIFRGARGEGMGRIGEGYGLESTMLPVVLQDQLSDLVKTQGFAEITTVNPDFLFAGTAMAYNSQQEYRDLLMQGKARGDFYKEIDREPINRSWQPRGNAKNAPQLISVNMNLAPDFQQLLGQFATYSSLVGQVAANYYPARDEQELWLFCSDEMGRSWVGNIELVSSVTTVGCRRDWLQAGDMVTPLYEHSTKAGNYGDPSDTRKGLVGMWNQYLSKIPVIQEYVAQRKR